MIRLRKEKIVSFMYSICKISLNMKKMLDVSLRIV